MKPRRLGYLLAVLVAGLFACPTWAESAGSPATEQDLFTEFKNVTKILDGLRLYNIQLKRQIEDQQRVMDQINTSIDSTEATRRQLVPLLHQMIDSLQRFVDLDLPFDLDERHARIQKLKDTMDRPDVLIAEKFKQVLDAYQKELDYSNSYQTYSEYIKIEGRPREVDVLRWGRLVLAFQTPDQKTAGVWDNQARQWKVLSSRYRDGIRKAFRVARGITSKDFVVLPVPAPTTATARTAQN